MINLNLFRKFRNLLHSKNKKFTHSIRNITGVTPINLSLYRLALTHSSVSNEVAIGIKRNNERLEYLGDAVIDLIIADLLYKRFPKKDEGFLTELRSKVVNGQMLNMISRKMGLDKLLITDLKRMHQSPRNRNIFADALEAFIGAVYLDKGYDETYSFIKDRVVALYVDFDDLVATESNFKSKILEWSQRNSKVVSYEMVQDPKGRHNKQFVLDLLIDNEKVSTGNGYSKKVAEQDAARKYFENNLSHLKSNEPQKN